jgi:hypothetical protein
VITISCGWGVNFNIKEGKEGMVYTEEDDIVDVILLV